MKILILCTGNSCRSQMAEGFLRSFHPRLQVWSAGTAPAGMVNPFAVKVMAEKGIDLSAGIPKSVDLFLESEFDYVVTVCGGAQEACPAFTGKVKNRLHIGFDDPADAKGTEAEILSEFRRVRDEIERDFGKFYMEKLKPELLKRTVQEKYGSLATADQECCGSSEGCCGGEISDFSEDYSALAGYNPDADLKLGCGIPTEYAGIRPGDTVVDLGAGAGNDCFVARSLTGADGRVIGIDFTAEMIEKATINKNRLGFKNIDFIKGDIENLPLQNSLADVVISNCVLNLVPDKPRAFAEIHRILKPGGHFCISDVVTSGPIPEAIKEDAILYAGCIAGAMEENNYLDVIRQAGFNSVDVKSRKRVEIPASLLQAHLTEEELETYVMGRQGVYSITVTGQKSSSL